MTSTLLFVAAAVVAISWTNCLLLVGAQVPLNYQDDLNDCNRLNLCGRKQYFVVRAWGNQQDEDCVNDDDEGKPCLLTPLDTTWMDYKGYCEMSNGRMAVIRDGNDDLLMRAQLGITNVPDIFGSDYLDLGEDDDDGYEGLQTNFVQLWLGARRQPSTTNDGQFYWVDGTKVEPALGDGPWLPGYPMPDNTDPADITDPDVDDFGACLAMTYIGTSSTMTPNTQIGWFNDGCGKSYGNIMGYLAFDDENYLPFYGGAVCECPDMCENNY